MADPRATIKFDDIGLLPVTFNTDGTTLFYDSTKAKGIGKAAGTGDAVMLSGNATVALTQDASNVIGKVILVEPDGKAHVDAKGFVKLPGGASATLTVGLPIVGAVGASSARGYVRVAASGTAAEVNIARGVIIDNSDTTNVVVML